MSHAYEREQHVAVQSVREAAALCQAVQAQITAEVLDKKDRSPVTVADFGSQALVCRALHKEFPEDPVIAEEDSAALCKPENSGLLGQVVQHVQRSQSAAEETDICRWIDFGGSHDYTNRFWTLDPIDGTKGFLRGEQYAIALALIVNGEIQLGVLGCPNISINLGMSESTGAIFAAVRGEGASVLPMDSHAPPKSIRVGSQDVPSLARFCESVESGHSSHNHAARVAAQLGITAQPIRLDSQAKYAIVARGEAEIYLRLPTRDDYREKIWDHAGGVLLVTEAGGRVTDLAGKSLEFTYGRELAVNRGVIVTNGHLHAHVLNAIEKLGLK